MANRSDRESGHPTECPRQKACVAEWDLVRGPHQGQQSFSDCINRPKTRLLPTKAATSNRALQRGSHPHRTLWLSAHRSSGARPDYPRVCPYCGCAKEGATRQLPQLSPTSPRGTALTSRPARKLVGRFCEHLVATRSEHRRYVRIRPRLCKNGLIW